MGCHKIQTSLRWPADCHTGPGEDAGNAFSRIVFMYIPCFQLEGINMLFAEAEQGFHIFRPDAVPLLKKCPLKRPFFNLGDVMRDNAAH
jgi:hypothetical protein